MRCIAWALTPVFGVVFSGGICAGSGPIVNTAGFESYSLTALESQPPWARAGAGGGSATVQNTIVQTGAKALRVQRAANSDDRWAVPVTGFPTHRFVLINWDMRVEHTVGAANTFGPFFGVDAYDDNPVVRVAGALGVDASTSDVLYQQTDTGALTPTGESVVFGQWYNYGMLLDFTSHQYSIYFDGFRILTTGFVDRGVSGANVDQFTDADIAAIGAAPGASLALTGTAYIDNFTVYDGVPGDFDFDADVDAADYNAWQTAFGSTASGDADGDNDSDGADFLIWQEQRGVNLLLATSVAGAVPEPGGAVLAALAVLGIGMRRGGGRPRA